MKLVKVLFLLSMFAALTFAQQAPQILTQTVGSSNPDPGQCNDASLFRTYMLATDPANGFSGLFLCVQSAPRQFAWAAVEVLPPGTTGTHATAVQVYNTFCGSTVGTQACANQTNAGTVHTVSGITTLATGAAVISSISPAFTGTGTYACAASDQTTKSNAVNVANTSTSSITLSGTTSDVITWVCSGY